MWTTFECLKSTLSRRKSSFIWNSRRRRSNIFPESVGIKFGSLHTVRTFCWGHFVVRRHRVPIYYVFNGLKIYRHRYLSWSVKIIQTLSFERSAGVAPEVNLRILLCPNNEAHKWGVPLWLWNPGQTSPKVHNRGISGPTKRTDVLQKILQKNTRQKSFSFKLINLTP